jgi:hypothetical protein
MFFNSELVKEFSQIKLMKLIETEQGSVSGEWTVVVAPGAGGLALQKSHKLIEDIKILLFGKLKKVLSLELSAHGICRSENLISIETALKDLQQQFFDNRLLYSEENILLVGQVSFRR